MTASPIFIGGLFKSGTSLLRAMLGQHSQIASGLETYWFRMPFADASRTPDASAALEKDLARLSEFFEIPRAQTANIAARSATPEDFLDGFMGTYATQQHKRRWAEKTPGNICHLDRIYARWPAAKFLAIHRDPRDVFASMKEAKKWETVPVFVDLWRQHVGEVHARFPTITSDADRYLEIRYEDLVAKPEETMRRVMKHVDEPWEPAVGRFQGKDEEFAKVKEVTGKESTTLRRLQDPLTQTRVGIWRGVVPEAEIGELRAAVESLGLLREFDALTGA